MFEKKVKKYYEMNEKQFTEMKCFYLKLGYSAKQAKRLSKNCFGAEIRVKSRLSYSPSWTFSRRIDNVFNPAQYGRALNASGGISKMMGMARMAVSAPADEDGMICVEECAAAPVRIPMDMPMPMGAPMPVPAVFNTAETNDVPENEVQSPLDKPQAIFSANVNTASWTYLRSRVFNSKPIDKSFVRIEEIINSYPFDLPLPENGELFSITSEVGKCPWSEDSELLFIGMKGKKVTEEVRQNLAFLIDVSGSMEDEWILVQMSLATIISKLKKGDVFSVIAYSDDTVTVAKDIDCGDLDRCVDIILSIDGIGGCTNGSEGLENVYTYLSEHYGEDKNNRVFIFTDGDFNFGVTSEGSLKELILKKRETGIYLSVVGYGMHNFKDNKMETLARNGNGNYIFISNPADITDMLWEKLISNLVTVAKDVKISVEPNPEYISSYRLIGYDSRALTQKEFHDTEKAVDGIGSEHITAALIEFKRGKAKHTFPSRYVDSASKGTSEELAFVEVHYKSQSGENLVMTKPITQTDALKADGANIAAASCLAAFGLLVKDSEYKGSADKALLQQLLDKLSVIDNDDNASPYGHCAVIEKYLSKN